MFDLQAVQASLREFRLDGWLLYDFRGSNLPARRVLGLDQKPPGSRRVLYFVPAEGAPAKLVHRIETGALDDLPGEKLVYLRWQELEAGVAELVRGRRRVAMEYAPRVSNPYVSRVDAGTIELVRDCGVEIVSSGDLVQQFEATWDDAQWQMHLEAEQYTTAAFDLAFGLIAERVRAGGTVREVEVQSAIMDYFHRHGMTTYSPPIVGVGPHSGDPHYEPAAGHDAAIGRGDFVLVDLWAKMDRPRSVYSDLTRVGFVGDTVPMRYDEVFAVVARARDAAIATVRDAYAAGRAIQGWEVDTAARRGSTKPATAATSSTAPGTTSARRSTATGPTWMTSRRMKSGWYCAEPASRSSPAFTSTISACVARSTFSWMAAARCTSPADCRRRSCRSWRKPLDRQVGKVPADAKSFACCPTP